MVPPWSTIIQGGIVGWCDGADYRARGTGWPATLHDSATLHKYSSVSTLECNTGPPLPLHLSGNFPQNWRTASILNTESADGLTACMVSPTQSYG